MDNKKLEILNVKLREKQDRFETALKDLTEDQEGVFGLFERALGDWKQHGIAVTDCDKTMVSLFDLRANSKKILDEVLKSTRVNTVTGMLLLGILQKLRAAKQVSKKGPLGKVIQSIKTHTGLVK